MAQQLWTSLCRRFLGCLDLHHSFFVVDLFVCFLCVLSWMKSSAFLFSAPRRGGRKAKRFHHCLSAPLICCFSLAIYSFYCFGSLICHSSSHSSPTIAHSPLSRSLVLSLSLCHLATSALFIAAAGNRGQEDKSEQGMETKQDT